MTQPLSEQQRLILLWVADHDDQADPHWGLPVRLTTGASPSTRASMSRALRRLEQRGLVRRRNGQVGDQYMPSMSMWGKTPDEVARLHAGTRTLSVQLTEAGWEAVNKLRSAQLLTGKDE